jgi:ribosomal-protein-alanine N-acetyltransferase
MEAACFGWMRNFFGLSPKVGAADARVWIAEMNGAPAGYLIAYQKPLHGEQTLYVGGVGTLAQFRKRGIAEALMAAVFAVDPGVWLHVRASNTPAVRLYEKLGMHVAERLPKFYSNGEDALVMATAHAVAAHL